MVPSVVVALESFPLLPGGKIDVRALPAPDWSGAGEEEYVAPVDDIEIAVQRVFAEVLGRPVEEVSVEADFYAAGGTSLQVFRAVALLADQIGVHVPATDFIATPTARQVAYIIKKKQRLAGALDLDIVYAKDWTDNERPVSSGQESLYMSFLLNPASLELNEGPCVELHGDLNLSVFEAALNELVQRHEVFRYSFQHSSNGVQIFLTDVVKVPFKIMEAGLTKAEIRKRLEKEYAVPFDLSSPPLLRCTIAPIGPKEHIVFLPMHHILMDGWSAGRLWVDVMGLYTAALTNTVADLPALPVKFGDYAAWERMLLAPDTPEHNKLLDYWKGKLKYATPVVQLPYDHPRPMNGASESPPVALGTTLNLDAVKILKDVGSKKRLSLYSICAAAYRMMLCEFSASDDVVIASSYSIRPPGTENLFGYFLRMLLLRNRLEEGDTFATLAQREMKTLTGAIEHSILPLQDVIRVSDFPRAPGRTPAWQASITWDEEDWMDPSAAKNKAEAPLAIKLFPLHPPTSPTDITLGLIPSANGLHLSLHADGAIFLPATVQRMLNRIVSILEAAAADMDQPLTDQVRLAREDIDEVLQLSMGPERPEYVLRTSGA
ncbi:hypothetical protein Ndes2437A_g07409 [Nannochloris sp. 'desiccata']